MGFSSYTAFRDTLAGNFVRNTEARIQTETTLWDVEAPQGCLNLVCHKVCPNTNHLDFRLQLGTKVLSKKINAIKNMLSNNISAYIKPLENITGNLV